MPSGVLPNFEGRAIMDNEGMALSLMAHGPIHYLSNNPLS